MKIAKPPFTMIAPQIKSPSDPSKGVAATVSGNAVTFQEVSEFQSAVPSTHPLPSRGGLHRTIKGNLTGTPTGAVAQIEFDPAATVHSIPFNLFIGSYELRSGHSASYSSSTDLVGEFQNSNNISPAANTLAVADFLATLETALQAVGFSTSVVGSTIEITAPIGLDYNDLEISYSIRGVATGSTPIVSITQFSGGLPSVGGIVIS
jgi:hypothetical protein